MNRLARRILPTVLLATLVTSAPASSQIDPVDQHPINARGVQPAHGALSLLPWERIDTYSGSVTLTFTDIDLPGDGGMNLRIRRTYNSKDQRWSWGIGPVVYQPMGDGLPLGNPVVLSDDGGSHHTFATAEPGVYMTTELWKWTPAEDTLEMPDGTTYHYWFSDNPRYPSRIQDRFGNIIDIAYEAVDGAARLTEIRQYVQGGERLLLLEYAEDGRLESINWNGRIWAYSFGEVDELTVQPPEGGAWTYVNDETGFLVTTPQGGWVRYVSQPVAGPDGPDGYPIYSRAVIRRESGGAGIESGTWTFDYHGSLGTYATVTAPSGTTHYWHLAGSPAMPLLSASEVRQPDDTVLERKDYFWAVGTRVGADDPWYLQQFPEYLEMHKDGRPSLPKEVKTKRRQAGVWKTWKTTYEYRSDAYNDFLSPWKVVEAGDFERTTTYTYDNSFDGLHLGGLVTNATVGTFSTTFGYDTRGFMTGRTQYGVSTTFVPDGAGNVASATDANLKETRYVYEWGAVKTIATPEYTVSRSINSDGTVGSETRRGYVTVFERDDLGRETMRTPPLGDRTTTSYAANAVTVTRGNTWTTTSLDGYGRPTGTENAVGVKTAVTYDAEGRPVYTSRPFSGASGYGVETTYDALGRPTATRDTADGATVTYAYDGVDVTITDVAIAGEPDRITVQYWEATGAPGRARLQEVKDADLQSTTYTYDALGALTDVASPGGITRQWRFDAKHFLQSETHPESGKTTYEPDAVGNVRKRTDATGQFVHYEYDGNNRLTEVKPNGRPDYDTSMTYDGSDNRLTANNSHVHTTWTFDGANRLTVRTDVIGGRTLVTEYVPDTLDRVSHLWYPSWSEMPTSARRIVRYQYDGAGRINDIRDLPGYGSRVYASAITYNPSGTVRSYTAGNDLVHTMTEDQRGRPEVIDAGGALQLTYGYDPANNVRSVVDPRAGRSQTFDGYDNLHRLTRANGPWGTLTYGYDAVGNRTSKTRGTATTTYVFDAHQRLDYATGASPEDFGVNGIGQLMSDGRGAYTYTPTGMLEQATLGTGLQMTFRYDGDDMRTIRSWGTNTRYYVHGPSGNLLREVMPDGSDTKWLRDYIYLGSRLIASVKDGPMVALSGPTSVTEGSGGGTTAVAMTLTLTTPDGSPITEALTATMAARGSASNPADFSLSPTSVTWSAGTPSGTQRVVQISVVKDNLFEGHETVILDISPAGQPTLTHTLTIQNDDAAPVLSALELTNQAEGHAGRTDAPAYVRLSAVSGRDTQFRLQTRGVTASIPQDLDAVDQVYTILAGQIEKVVPIRIVGERLVEPHEKFEVVVSEAVNATIGQAVAPGWILNDDVPPRVFAYDAVVTESSFATTVLMVPIRLEWAYPEPITVTVATNPVTAQSTVDFGPLTSVAVVIPANAMGSDVAIPIVGDTEIEGTETFTLSIAGVSSNASVGRTPAVCTINDDDQPTMRSRWYFAEGATGVMREDITLFNPTTTAESVTARFWRPDGSAAVAPRTYPLNAGSLLRLNVNEVVPSGDVSVEVTEANSRDLVAERSMYWFNDTCDGGHNAFGVAQPSLNWYLAEGHTAFESFVPIANPGLQTAQVTVTVRNEAGTPYPQMPVTLFVPPFSRSTLWINGLIGGNLPFTVTVHSTSGIIVERAMYHNGWAGGHASVATPRPRTTWHFAEGSTQTVLGLSTYFMVFNPNAASTSATLRFMKDNGVVVTKSVPMLQPYGRATIDVWAYPELRDTAFATLVTGAAPIVVERSMYWSGWIESHNTAGAESMSTHWWFADGTQGVPASARCGASMDTYFLLMNEQDVAAPITLRFVTDAGQQITRSMPLAPHSRLTVSAGQVEELLHHRFATEITSGTVPIVAERAVYWGAQWSGGHASVGARWAIQ